MNAAAAAAKTRRTRLVKPSKPYNPWLWCRGVLILCMLAAPFPIRSSSSKWSTQAQVDKTTTKTTTTGIKLYFHFPLHFLREIGASEAGQKDVEDDEDGDGDDVLVVVWPSKLISVHLANGQTIFAYHAETGRNIFGVVVFVVVVQRNDHVLSVVGWVSTMEDTIHSLFSAFTVQSCSTQSRHEFNKRRRWTRCRGR